MHACTHSREYIRTMRTAASPATDPGNGSTDVVSVVIGVGVAGNAVTPITAITTVRWVCGEMGLVREKEKLRSVPARKVVGPAKEMSRIPDCAQLAGEVRGALQTMGKAALSGVALPAGGKGKCCKGTGAMGEWGQRRSLARHRDTAKRVQCIAGSVAALDTPETVDPPCSTCRADAAIRMWCGEVREFGKMGVCM
jgi:hypothetical protein